MPCGDTRDSDAFIYFFNSGIAWQPEAGEQGLQIPLCEHVLQLLRRQVLPDAGHRGCHGVRLFLHTCCSSKTGQQGRKPALCSTLFTPPHSPYFTPPQYLRHIVGSALRYYCCCFRNTMVAVRAERGVGRDDRRGRLSTDRSIMGPLTGIIVRHQRK